MKNTSHQSDCERSYIRTVEKYKNLVLWVCNKHLNSMDDAEEAAQEVFIRYYKNQERIRNPASWLYSCARSTAKDRRNSLLARRRREMEWDYLNLTECNEIDYELQHRMLECIAALPMDQRELLRLYYFEGHTQQNLAKRYHVSQGTIHKRLARILETVRSQVVQQHRLSA